MDSRTPSSWANIRQSSAIKPGTAPRPMRRPVPNRVGRRTATVPGAWSVHSGPDTHDHPQVIIIHAPNHPFGHTDEMYSEHVGGCMCCSEMARFASCRNSLMPLRGSPSAPATAARLQENIDEIIVSNSFPARSVWDWHSACCCSSVVGDRPKLVRMKPYTARSMRSTLLLRQNGLICLINPEAGWPN